MTDIISRYPSPTTKNPYQLDIDGLDVPLDVLSFEGEEYLSKPFTYTIRFTCADPKADLWRVHNRSSDPNKPRLEPRDLDKAAFLNRTTRFAFYGKAPITYNWEEQNKHHAPLRELFGVVTAFRRTGASIEEGQYEIVLEPRFALLARGKQTRLYRNKSVPEIVQHILTQRHGFFSDEYSFQLSREYPIREHVIQYGETDLEFIERMLADVGIWYRFAPDPELGTEVLHFRDLPLQTLTLALPCLPRSGMSNSGEDSVWSLATQHRMVEKDLCFRTYDPRQANQHLEGQTEQWRLEHMVYGETYEYGWAYTEMGEIYSDRPQPESGHFFARLNYERNMNLRSQVSGSSTSPLLIPAHMLSLSGDIPQDCAEQVLVHSTRTKGARNAGYLVEFEGIPFDGLVGFRPALQTKPVICGTLPARITSANAYDRYSHIDDEGRYRVSFLFDRDKHEPGLESLPLRLARAYAGDRYGLHFPLVAGTEVAIAFEQGDPDRPYIAHALHDSEHGDHVAAPNHKRNVLRTPSNNKLRMEDEKGREHVKLSTEFAGKSQLNLGHLVDNKREKRGEGFELRTDRWGALRAGNGMLISAYESTKAQGDQLDMEDAIDQLHTAFSLLQSVSTALASATMTSADTDSLMRLKQALNGLTKPGILMNAPEGIGLVSPKAVCIASSSESVSVLGNDNVDIAAGEHLTVAAEGAVSVMAKADMQFKSATGKVELHARGNRLHALAKDDIQIESLNGRVEVTAPQELVLNCGGAYIRLKDGNIELGAPGNIFLKAAHVQKQGAATLETPATVVPSGYSGFYTVKNQEGVAEPFSRYRITTREGKVFDGVTDKDGNTVSVNTTLPGGVTLQPFGGERWISYSHAHQGDYSGYRCRLTLKDGRTLDNELDGENRAFFHLDEDMEVKKFEVFEDDGKKDFSSGSERILKALEG